MGNDEKPLVSICCISYNHEKFISQCLDGFIIQKVDFPFEIVISDDCSTDNTKKIIDTYVSKYPAIFKDVSPSKNLGSTKNFYHVLEKASGKYIALCEGDDYWIDENKLQMQVDFLENNPEYTMCFHSAELDVDGKHNVPYAMQNIKEKDYSATEIFENWIVPTASVLFKKSVLNYPMKNENKIMFGDIILFEKCVHLGKVKGFAKKMSVYRVHEQGVSHSWMLNKKRRLGFPAHYECIYENFQLIDKKIILDRIIRAYGGCFKHDGNVMDKIIYLKKIIFYFFLLLKNCICR
jgi:glycosyltransferase involved in cell wall biosynthesis